MLVVGVSGCYPVAPDPTPAVAGGSGIPRTDETWINAKKLTVQNDADFYTDVMIDGDEDAVQLTVQGHSTQTSDLFVAETSAGTDKFTIDNSGNTDIAGTLGVAGASTLTGALAANGRIDADRAGESDGGYQCDGDRWGGICDQRGVAANYGGWGSDADNHDSGQWGVRVHREYQRTECADPRYREPDTDGGCYAESV